MFEDDDLLDEDDRPMRRTDEVLRVLLEPLRARSSPRRRQRIDAGEQDLRRCLEVHADRLLTDPELAILEFEHAMQPDGAVARVAGPDILMLALPYFLREPEWHGADREDRRVRVHMSDLLAHSIPFLPELRQYSVRAAMWTVEYAVEDARRELRLDRGQRS